MELVTFYTRKGQPFIVDAGDSEAVGRYAWHLHSKGYPATAIGKFPHQKIIKLHRFLLGEAPDGLKWDHINRNKLDNRRSNFRAVTSSKNTQNSGVRSDSLTGLRGIGALTPGHYRVRIVVDGVRRFIGCFHTVEEAVAARRTAEREFWGHE